MDNTYSNPIYPRDFPDPFVLKYCGEYWAYCTGFQPDGGVFGVLYSRNLVDWQEMGSAMQPLPGDHPCYWAPEVTYDNGRFLLYYSVGNEERMHIRVAVADHPAGPFTDSGHRLTREPFAIDPHVFRDEDGRWYLFYATDFLDHSHTGTGTVYDEMRDPFTLVGRPQPVARACYDWQVYDPNRAEKGGVRWHTIEGPFVLKRKGRYYEMFSGGNWRNVSYGVAYAQSSRIDAGREWQQMCDGEQVLPILRTVPGKVIGPGHNSVVRGPDNRQLYCVYHRWADGGDGRLLAIDPLDWAGERMLVLGPSYTPQPAPLQPTMRNFFEGEHQQLGHLWHVQGGAWSVQDGAAIQTARNGTAAAHCIVGTSHFLVEVSLRATSEDDSASLGLGLSDGQQEVLRVALLPRRKQLVISWQDGSGRHEQITDLPPAFAPGTYHLLRLEVDGTRIHLALDDVTGRWQGQMATAPTALALVTTEATAAFAGFALTLGWEDLFTVDKIAPAALGWNSVGAPDGWHVARQQLQFRGEAEAALVKGSPLPAYEFVVNARLAENENGRYGFYPAVTEAGTGPLLVLAKANGRWALRWQSDSYKRELPLPSGFDPTVYQQFRLRKEDGRLTIRWEDQELGKAEVTTQPTRVGLYACGAATFDMARVTAFNLE